MAEENLSEEFRFAYTEKLKNYFIKEIDQIELMHNKHKKLFTALNYIKHFQLLWLLVSTSAFASFLGIPKGITTSAIGLKTCAITVGIKKYKSIIKKKKKKHNKIVLLGKIKVNSIEVLISKVLVDLYISHDELGLANNVLKNMMIRKKKKKNLKTSTVNKRF